MSLLKAIKAQLGLSNTPANNFTLDASAENGTLKLARGNAGATTQDILTVDANGNVLVDGNNLNLFSAKSLAASGYQKLPSGLIVQWGEYTANMVHVTNYSPVFPITFPNACLQVTHLVGPTVTTGTTSVFCQFVSKTASNYTFQYGSINGATYTTTVRYVAIGY